MCKLCDKIYSVTQTLPELEDYIQRDPEGAMQLNVLYYNHVYDNFYTTSRSIFYCPECGSSLYD